jgi:hypothetical protein
MGEDTPKQTLFPELAQGSYFGEIVLAGKRVGTAKRLSLLVVVQQAGRLSWGVGDYTVKEMENSHSGVANLLLPFKLDLEDGLVELTWERPECDSEGGCSGKAESISKWQGGVIWRGASGKKKGITVSNVDGGKIGGWYLRRLIDEPDRLQNGKLEAQSPAHASAAHRVVEQSEHHGVAAIVSPVPEISPAVQNFDLTGTLAESGFCALSDAALSDVIGKLQSDRNELAQQLYYTGRATPAGRLVWLSRLLLSQESSKIRPVTEVAVAPVIDNEIETEKKRLAALQALGIE